MTYPTEYVRRLSDADAAKVAKGELVGRLQNGMILESPQLWKDKNSFSLMGKVGVYSYSWPQCGCGVKMLIRAELPAA